MILALIDKYLVINTLQVKKPMKIMVSLAFLLTFIRINSYSNAIFTKTNKRMENILEFDAFKETFFTGAKIITHEMLDSCKKQYDNVILRMSDDAFFEPYKEANPQENIPILAAYEEDLNKSLGIDKITAHQIGILIKSSFDAESLLIVEKQTSSYKLMYKIFEHNHWLSHKNGENNSLKVFYSSLSVEVGDSFEQLIIQTINNARTNKSNFMTLDGEDYTLIKFIDGQLKKVHKNPTNESSKSYKIVRFIDDLNKIIVDNAIDVNENHLKKRITELI